jgi:hypothetical protein
MRIHATGRLALILGGALAMSMMSGCYYYEGYGGPRYRYYSGASYGIGFPTYLSHRYYRRHPGYSYYGGHRRYYSCFPRYAGYGRYYRGSGYMGYHGGGGGHFYFSFR